MEQINIQKEVGDILHKYGNSEMGLYKIQLLFDKCLTIELEKISGKLEVYQFLDDLHWKLRTSKRSDLVKERIATLKEANAPKEQIENYEKVLKYFEDRGL